MRELINNILSRHYNVVHQFDPNQQNNNNNQENLVQEQQLPQNILQQRRSLQAMRGFDRGFSILDSLFQRRQAGKRARWPTCKLNFCLRNFLLASQSGEKVHLLI